MPTSGYYQSKAGMDLFSRGRPRPAQSTGGQSPKGKQVSKAAVKTVKEEEEEDDEATTDPELYLHRNGCTELKTRFWDFVQGFKDCEQLADPMLDNKDLIVALKSKSVEITAVNKEAIALFWKLNKRKTCPQAAIDMLNVFRGRVAACLVIVTAFAVKTPERNVDLEKVNRSIQTLLADPDHACLTNFSLPPKLVVVQYQATSENLYVYDQFEELREHWTVLGQVDRATFPFKHTYIHDYIHTLCAHAYSSHT